MSDSKIDGIIATVNAKLAEVQRMRDRLSEVEASLAGANEELARAEETLAAEQCEVALGGDPHALKRTPGLKAVKDLGDLVVLLKAQRAGLNARIRSVLAELHETEVQLEAATAEFKATETRRAETEYLAAVEVFGKAMAKAAARFDSLGARRQSQAVRESRLHDWDDGWRPLVRVGRVQENPAYDTPEIEALREQGARAVRALQAIRAADGQVPEQQPEAASA